MSIDEPLNVERGITFGRLTANSSRNIIANIVSEQIKMIDAKIVTAHTAGFNKIAYELPINFGVNNLAKADAQLIIYSELLSIYSKSEEEGGKGFNKVAIDIDRSGTSATFFVQWMNGMDEEEREQRRKIITQFAIVQKPKNGVKK